MRFFCISHVYQSALSLSTALDPLPTQLHPVIKEPKGTRILIVRPGICTPWCRADLLTPVLHPPFFLSLPSPAHPGWMQFLWIGQCVVNLLDSAPGSFIIDMSQTTSKACWGWMTSSGSLHDELIRLVIYMFCQWYPLCIRYQTQGLMHEHVRQQHLL